MAASPSDHAGLADRIRSGDEAAFEMLFREWYGTLVGFAGRFLQQDGEAEEVVQDLFVKMWEQRERLDLRGGFKSYLFTATRNACLNRLKHLQVRKVHEEAVLAAPALHAASPDEALQQAELESRISKAIGELPERCREVFCLSRFEGLKYDEIADRLDISPRTVETQIGKALRKLRESLQDLLAWWLVLLTWTENFW